MTGERYLLSGWSGTQYPVVEFDSELRLGPKRRPSANTISVEQVSACGAGRRRIIDISAAIGNDPVAVGQYVRLSKKASRLVRNGSENGRILTDRDIAYLTTG